MSSPVVLPLTQPYFEDAEQMYLGDFLEDEPVSRSLDLGNGSLAEFIRRYVRYLAEKNTGFVAQVDGKPAGFIFCLDMADTLENIGEWTRPLSEGFREGFALIGELEAMHFDPAAIRHGEVFYIFQLGVDRTFRGRGVGRALITAAIGQARERGYQCASADCTNPGSWHTFAACGFRKAAYIPYRDFSFEGNRIFSEIPGGISLMVRDV